MQGLAQKDQIDGGIRDRRLFQIPVAILQIGKAIRLGDLGSIFHHLFGGIDRDDPLRPLGQQLGKCAFPRSQIRDHLRRHQQQQGLRQRLPRPARQITAAELPRQLVKINPRGIRTLPQHQLQRRPVRRSFRDFRGAFPQQRTQRRTHPVQPIDGVLPRSPRLHQTRVLQQPQLRRNPALFHRQDLLQFGHRQFRLVQQEQQPQPGRFTEKAEGVEQREHRQVGFLHKSPRTLNQSHQKEIPDCNPFPLFLRPPPATSNMKKPAEWFPQVFSR